MVRRQDFSTPPTMGIQRIRDAIKKVKRITSTHRKTQTDGSSTAATDDKQAENDQDTVTGDTSFKQVRKDVSGEPDSASKIAISVPEASGNLVGSIGVLKDVISTADQDIVPANGDREKTIESRNIIHRNESIQMRTIGSRYSTSVVVIVGDVPETFMVHETIICERSTFFKSALMGVWKESETKAVTLPEQEPALFGAYLVSIYNSNIGLLDFISRNADDLVGDDEDDFNGRFKPAQKALHALIKLYIMGDFLGDVKFKDHIIKGIVEGINSDTLSIKDAAARLVFEGTSPDCGLQKLFADIIASVLVKEKDPEAVDRLERKYSSAAVVATMKALKAKRYGDNFPQYLLLKKYVEGA